MNADEDWDGDGDVNDEADDEDEYERRLMCKSFQFQLCVQFHNERPFPELSTWSAEETQLVANATGTLTRQSVRQSESQTDGGIDKERQQTFFN